MFYKYLGQQQHEFTETGNNNVQIHMQSKLIIGRHRHLLIAITTRFATCRFDFFDTAVPQLSIYVITQPFTFFLTTTLPYKRKG